MIKELYTVTEFCEAYGIGRTYFYSEVNAGKLKITKLGGGTRVRRTDAESWADSLPTTHDVSPRNRRRAHPFAPSSHPQ